MATNLERQMGQARQENPWNDIKDKGKFLVFLNKYARALMKSSGEDGGLGVIPHLIMSNGFMSWQRILTETGELKYDRTKDRAEQNLIQRREFEKFSKELFDMSAFSALTAQEQIKLREDGWRTYLEH